MTGLPHGVAECDTGQQPRPVGGQCAGAQLVVDVGDDVCALAGTDQDEVGCSAGDQLRHRLHADVDAGFHRVGPRRIVDELPGEPVRVERVR